MVQIFIQLNILIMSTTLQKTFMNVLLTVMAEKQQLRLQIGTFVCFLLFGMLHCSLEHLV